MSEVSAKSWEGRAKRQREAWRDAKRFQRRVQMALAGLRVSFPEWLVLSMIAELMPEHGENVSQNALARQTGLTRVTAGHWARVLENRGLVNRGEHDNPRAWGVILTERGANVLAQCNERLEFLPYD